jgi:UDP-N-acetylmuramoyl-tripeptide--D-alanyl-D-alanine ligase
MGVDPRAAGSALAGFTAPAGRGQRHRLAMGAGSATLLDESYNANPASMRAALELLGATTVIGTGRRIAVLGDMLELGRRAEALHEELASAVIDNGIDVIYAAGPLMRALYDALPQEVRGGWAESAAELEPMVIDVVGRGDAVMIKGSLGSRMGSIVAALIHRFAPSGASSAA